MTDFFIIDELHKMIKAIKKPRLAYKKGITLKGYFRPYMSLKDYTKAVIFSDIDKEVPVTVRFASLLGDNGTADTRRNMKSIFIKFHTDDSEYDLICQNIPVSMINDKDKLLELFSVYRSKEPFDGINKNKFWKYVSMNPESLLFAVMIYSGMGITDSFININYYSVNSCLWYNESFEKRIIRYKLMPSHTIDRDDTPKRNMLTVNTSEFMAGYAPDKALNEIIGRLKYDKYISLDLYIQMIEVQEPDISKLNDRTLLWDDKEAPYLCIGSLLLDESYSSEEERINYFPGNNIDGISVINDELSNYYEYLAHIEAMERGNCV